jgi:hypothetical protein
MDICSFYFCCIFSHSSFLTFLCARLATIQHANSKWKNHLLVLSSSLQNLHGLEIKVSIFSPARAKNTLITIFKEYVNAIPNETIREPLGIQIDLSKIKPYLEGIDPTSILRTILEESRILLSQGIELDSISEEDLLDIVMVRSARQGSKNNRWR